MTDTMTNNEPYETDVLTMLLSWQWHKNSPLATRSNRVSKTLRKIRVRTKQQAFHDTCTLMIKACAKHRYTDFFKAIEAVNRGYIAKTVLLNNPDLVQSNDHFDYLVRTAMDNDKLVSQKQMYYYLIDLAQQ